MRFLRTHVNQDKKPKCAIIKKSANNKCTERGWRKWNPPALWEYKLVQSLWKMVQLYFYLFVKVKIRYK